MTRILSRNMVTFDITADNFRAKAADLGEVVAMMAGGLRPDPEAVSRLLVSMRSLQGFLIEEATQQQAREAIRCVFPPVTLPVPPYASAVKPLGERLTA